MLAYDYVLALRYPIDIRECRFMSDTILVAMIYGRDPDCLRSRAFKSSFVTPYVPLS